MARTFLFYDLETSGFSPRTARIMQFGGQRVDMDLKPIGKPYNFFIKLSDDVLPDPDAILVTGITPQKVNQEGLTEAEFLDIFANEIAIPGTVFVGYNTVRFDDEFMRFLLYRNFYDPYEWQWQNDKSRWDLLDLVRMTRALRPDGIKWPFAHDGRPSNTLGLLASVNNLDHNNAHDALSDVMASLSLAQLIKTKQPKLFNFLLNLRGKQNIADFVSQNPTFVYTSGKYPSDYEKTAIVSVLADHPTRQGVLVYDLRQDPEPFLNLSVNELVNAWKRRWDEPGLHLPVKTLQFNRCPALAPLSVLDDSAKKRLQIDMSIIKANEEKLKSSKTLVKKILTAQEQLDKQQQTTFLADEKTVEEQLYDGFFDRADKIQMDKFRHSSPDEFESYKQTFEDTRLKNLILPYKARNFYKNLTDEEKQKWEEYRLHKLTTGDEKSRQAIFNNRLQELKNQAGLTKNQQDILKDIEDYARAVLPK